MLLGPNLLVKQNTNYYCTLYFKTVQRKKGSEHGGEKGLTSLSILAQTQECISGVSVDKREKVALVNLTLSPTSARKVVCHERHRLLS